MVETSVWRIGTIEGQAAETERGDVNVEFAGQHNFTPRYLAENDIADAARRYGQGGADYRFNDIHINHWHIGLN